MSLIRAATSGDLWPSMWSDIGKWFEGWWHVDTLGPDLLVGVATGAAVGFIVLKYEKGAAGRSLSREVAKAQEVAVDRARSALRFDIHFYGDNQHGLHADLSLLERVVEAVKAVPTGEPSVHVPGYHWVQRLATGLTELEALADALDARIADFDRKAANAGALGIWIKINIREMSALDPSEEGSWSWRWHPQLPTAYTETVEKDTELRSIIRLYVEERRLAHAYRKAFLHTMEYILTEENQAVSDLRNAAGGRFRGPRARKAAEGRIEAAKAWADLQSVGIVSRVESRDT